MVAIEYSDVAVLTFRVVSMKNDIYYCINPNATMTIASQRSGLVLDKRRISKGVQRYGRQWMKIKATYPIFKTRTSIQTRDKTEDHGYLARSYYNHG